MAPPKEKIVAQAGKELPNYPGLAEMPGWKAVEKVYGTGSYAGQTYVRFYGPGHGSVCSIKKAMALHAEDTGQDVSKVVAAYEAAKEAEKARKDAEREAKGLLEGERKKDAIEAFKAAYGALDGATVCLMPGWRGESKFLPNSGQVCARYYSPDGTQYSLINQIEALFGFKMLNGKTDEIPDIEKARNSRQMSESGKVIHAARKAEAVKEDFEFAEAKPEAKRRKKEVVMFAEAEHYRATELVKIVRLLTDSAEVDLQAQLVPEHEQVVADSLEIQRLLGERGASWAPDMLYVTGARSQRSAGVRIMNQFSGFYFYRCPYNDRPCYQRVLKEGNNLACSGHHLMWSNLRKQWKIGVPVEEKAGIAVCNQDTPDPFSLDDTWRIFEPKIQDLEAAAEEAVAAEKAAREAARMAEAQGADTPADAAASEKGGGDGKAASAAGGGGGKDAAS